jgi:hypothetical protein
MASRRIAESPEVNSRMARLMLDHAREGGAVPKGWLAQRAIDTRDNGPRIRLSLDDLAELGDLLATATSDPFFGLHVAIGVKRGAYGLVEFAAWSAATLGDALERLTEYGPLVSDVATVSLEPRGREAVEQAAAFGPKSVRERFSYVAKQWAHEPKWVLHPNGGERWYGFDAVRPIPDVDEVFLVPLAGHTRGHCGVAVRGDHGWILQAGDAFLFRGEVDADAPTCPPGLAFFEWLLEEDRKARLANVERLRALQRAEGGAVTIVCSHDPVQFDELQEANRWPRSSPVGLTERIPA